MKPMTISRTITSTLATVVMVDAENGEPKLVEEPFEAVGELDAKAISKLTGCVAIKDVRYYSRLFTWKFDDIKALATVTEVE